jgi:hypothetical protein
LGTDVPEQAGRDVFPLTVPEIEANDPPLPGFLARPNLLTPDASPPVQTEARQASETLQPGSTLEPPRRLETAAIIGSPGQMGTEAIMGDLLTELLEIRRDLKEMRTAVDALHEAQRRRPAGKEVTPNRTGVFTSFNGTPAET